MKILVVEDEGYVADLLRRALEDLGNSCCLARDTLAADELLREAAVDAVTLDLCMPGRDGLVWLESMAERRPELARRTLVITGLPLAAESVERVARCGAGVLAKPFTLEGLHDALRCQLDRPIHGRRN
jgi:DNA-binding response OmpR family regulator